MRSESHSEVITLEVGGYTGTAEVAWITGSIYSIAHYGALYPYHFKIVSGCICLYTISAI